MWSGLSCWHSIILASPRSEYEKSVCIPGEKLAMEREREQREVDGITLAAIDTHDKTKHTYYHFMSEGEKTQDWMWFMKQRIEKLMFEARFHFRAASQLPIRNLAYVAHHLPTTCRLVTLMLWS